MVMWRPALVGTLACIGALAACGNGGPAGTPDAADFGSCAATRGVLYSILTDLKARKAGLSTDDVATNLEHDSEHLDQLRWTDASVGRSVHAYAARLHTVSVRFTRLGPAGISVATLRTDLRWKGSDALAAHCPSE